MKMSKAVSPFQELVAYETLWADLGKTLTSLRNIFLETDNLPSEVLENKLGLFYKDDKYQQIEDYLFTKSNFSVCLKNDFQYPQKLIDSKYAIGMLYYKGDISLFEMKSVSVVGTRKATLQGMDLAIDIVKELVKHEYAIVSGLAKGIDTYALNSAIEEDGRVIAVIGTPIDKYYPIANAGLQDKIACNNLLVSQVPFYRYEKEPFSAKKNYFPERNTTMSAISEATVIVEASETSGTRTQARACLSQGKKLFLSDIIANDAKLTWPEKYIKAGAVVFSSAAEILNHLKS